MKVTLRGGPAAGTINLEDELTDAPSILIPAAWRMPPIGKEMTSAELAEWIEKFESAHGHRHSAYLYVRARDGAYDVDDKKPDGCELCGVTRPSRSGSKMTAQQRTAVAARIKARAQAALAATVRVVDQYRAEQAERTDEDGAEQSSPPDPSALYAAALSDILEEELKAQPGSVDKALQMDAALKLLTQVLGGLDRQYREQLLHRESLAMILQHQIHGTIPRTEKTEAVAKSLEVELSSIEIAR